MGDPVEVTLDTDEGTESVRVYDDDGSVETGDATVSFSFRTGGTDEDSTMADDGADPIPAADDTDATTTDRYEDPRRIAASESVPTDGTLRFEARRDGRGVDCILHRVDDAVVAWRNSCPHRPEVSLDTGDGALVRGDKLVCHEHGARFERGCGSCTAGPCTGESLESVAVTVREGAVYLADDRFDAARVL